MKDYEIIIIERPSCFTTDAPAGRANASQKREVTYTTLAKRECAKDKRAKNPLLSITDNKGQTKLPNKV